MAGERIACATDNLTIEGAHVRIHQAGAPTLAIGHRIDLELTDSDTGGSLSLSSKVMFRDEVPTGRTYGLQFNNPDEVRKLLTPALAKLFKRRQDFRVPLDEGKVVATLRLPREAGVDLIEGPMVDLSTSGCAVLVTLAQESQLVDFTQLDILFKLPLTSMPCLLYGDIRYRELAGERVRYGIEFQKRDDGDYGRSLEDVIEFVMQIQNEML